MTSKLPPTPNFEAIEAMAPQSADQSSNILSLIGNLTFSWSNNESMFIYLLMILLKTDFKTAAITFVTLNTTRARLDLVRRLAKSNLPDPEIVKKIEKLIERFNRCTRLRNEFNHCIYRVDESGRITHADMLRIKETNKELSIVTTKEFDSKRIRQITNTIRQLKKINRDIWELLPELEKYVHKISR